MYTTIGLKGFLFILCLSKHCIMYEITQNGNIVNNVQNTSM